MVAMPAGPKTEMSTVQVRGRAGIGIRTAEVGPVGAGCGAYSMGWMRISVELRARISRTSRSMSVCSSTCP